MTAINSSKTAVVDRDYHYLKIDKDTPRGVMMLLINRRAGIPMRGIYTGDSFWTHWAPLPTFAKDQT